jgi:hypothetical protein
VTAALALILGSAALVATIGADSRWLAALGRVIVRRDAIPHGIPFAAAPTDHWPNVLVLAELTLDGVERLLGDRGLMVAQLIAVGGAIAVMARDAQSQGASSLGTAWALSLAALGALPSLAIARVQLFSLVLFPTLVALLRAEARRPSRRIWLVVPLLALWSNLHGAALLGLAVTLVYLALVRWRQTPRTAVFVGLAAPVALSLTPAGIRTVAYYHGVLTNQAAARGQGLWGPLSLAAPLDVLLIIAAVALTLLVLRSRPPLWERVVLVLLAALTVHASRSGVWLLFFLVPHAATAFRRGDTEGRLVPILAVVGAAALIFGVIRGPLSSGGSRALLDRAIVLAGGTPVLAEDALAEQVAMSGGRIWAGDPIDAFSTTDQTKYLDWLQGRGAGRRAVGADVRVVLVTPHSAAARLTGHIPGLVAIESDRAAELFVRKR